MTTKKELIRLRDELKFFLENKRPMKIRTKGIYEKRLKDIEKRLYEMEERCELCKYYQSLCAGAGACRRHAPVIVEVTMSGLCSWIGERPPDRRLDSKWPQVKLFDWCGDFEKKPLDNS